MTHTFVIQCADRTSGKPYNIRVAARDAEEAMQQAVKSGHMVGGKPVMEFEAVTPITADADAARHEELERDLRRLTGEVIALRGTIERMAASQLLGRPIVTIASGIILALLAWAFLLVCFWFALGSAVRSSPRPNTYGLAPPPAITTTATPTRPA